jgi:putative nucleotidyltransferase with HDIG domain
MERASKAAPDVRALRDALIRIPALEDAVMKDAVMRESEDLRRVRASIGEMPALPVTVGKVVDVCNTPGTSPVDLNRVISLDPVLMARVMRLINSAYYGMSTRINSLVRAIIMLGLNTVKNLALSTAVIGNLNDGANFQALDARGFWRHSLGVGVMAKLLAKRRGVHSRVWEEYFIAGLLHDIGKIPMNRALAEEFIDVMGQSDLRHIPLHQAERERFGFSHVDAGDMIGETWNLQEAFMDAILHHHDPEAYGGSQRDLVLTVSVANYFVNIAEIGFSGDRYPAPLSDALFAELGIDRDLIDEMEDEVHREIEKAEVFLQDVD